ncbi:hypothetical protein OF83DRAFT_659515 [Amylostereum chailletii]|nr:hypothetical protein OF83DRAFT_659515 [Amylostereum chailletii]
MPEFPSLPATLRDVRRGAETIRVVESEDTLHLRDGDVVTTFFGRFTWDSHCVSYADAERWAREGDPLCDAAIEEMAPGVSCSMGIDLFAALEEHVRVHPEGDARKFLDHVLHPPPPDLLASQEDVDVATDFFLDHAIHIAEALIFFSLVGGFSSPRIMKTLKSVSHLLPSRMSPDSSAKAQGDKTYIRLVETFQFVLDVLNCTSGAQPSNGPVSQAGKHHLLPGGAGWRSIVQVRMLHGIMRRRARQRLSRSGEDAVECGAINQMDMSATFSAAPLWCLSRFRVPASDHQAHAYLAVWRHVGFYLGVSPEILHTHFSTPFLVDRFFASSSIHILSDPLSTMDDRDSPALSIIRALSDHLPIYTSYELECAPARHLLGHILADHIRLPPSRWTVQAKLRLIILIQNIPVFFGRYYPRRGWAKAHRVITKAAIVSAVQRTLEMRKAAFQSASSPGTKDPGADLEWRAQRNAEVERILGGALKGMWEVVAVLVALICAGLAVVSTLCSISSAASNFH